MAPSDEDDCVLSLLVREADDLLGGVSHPKK
jgi:hypothetical protein